MYGSNAMNGIDVISFNSDTLGSSPVDGGGYSASVFTVFSTPGGIQLQAPTKLLCLLIIPSKIV
jgi:hypothetical protein